ncbi:AMP-binding protein [Heliobacterium gestii]|uniref:Phenylacetate-coenzyme A ligase n=1 Tax=Heliomicrobium gestii TaxID=2699 RepID=A0A845L6Z5_HELGE|nr:phenylacetate--CoA ligase [Heliomicrobium gestii]MBM7865751.1 phenylacetate-CoA ligase [Heliomicrobium gestii]MZP41998.1 AMP-binding protein [Heliomicrobium gestii]
MIWNREMECIDRESLRQLQLGRLRETLHRVYDKVPFYRQRFDAAGVRPDDLQTLEDIGKFPFTTKTDLRDQYPFGLFAVPKKELVRLHASSGTTGKPVVGGYTWGDLERWTEQVARIAAMAGVTSDDTAQIAFTYGLFTGGFGLHYGLEKVGCAIVPASGGNTQRQIMLMQDFETSVLVCTPSYALHMAEEARAMGIDPTQLPLRVGLFGSEPWSEGMRREIQNAWGIRAFDNYGLTELGGPGVAGECLHADGLHILEDCFLAEVIDPETGEPVADGCEGELVFTTLTKEGFPVIRYRTKDISCLDRRPCPCGRTLTRMRRVTGRTDDMLIVRGVNVFPSQIESVLMEISGVAPHYLLVVDRQGYLDTLEVQVELAEERFVDNYRELEALTTAIRERLKSVLSVSAKVRLVEPRSLERSPGKAKRVLDRRPKD